MNESSQNIRNIMKVAGALGDLLKEVVFVGGGTRELYATTKNTDYRASVNVYFVVKCSSRHEYSTFEKKLSEKGFVNDVNAPVLCRYIYKGIMIGAMPTSENILGFSNHWYNIGFIKKNKSYTS